MAIHASVNTLAPDAIETDFGGGAVWDSADANRYIAEQATLGRAGRPEDIGDLVAQWWTPASPFCIKLQ